MRCLPRWAPSGISRGEKEHSCKRDSPGKGRLTTAQGVLGTEAHRMQLRLVESWQRSLEKGGLIAGSRCESAGPRGCRETPGAAAAAAAARCNHILGRIGSTHRSWGAVPVPQNPRIPAACPPSLLCTHCSFWYPHMTLSSPPSSLFKGHLPRGPSPDSIDLKLQTLPTLDAP